MILISSLLANSEHSLLVNLTLTNKDMEEMKFYTLEEIEDKHIGQKGTPRRDKYEDELHSFLIGKAIKQARQSN